MKLTTTWMATNFARFNRKYFKDRLPTPRFIIVDSTEFLGQCTVNRSKLKRPNFCLKLSNHIKRTEYQYLCTLLHEMIHLYWFSKGELNVGHGDKFVEMALQFRKLGWNIHFERDTKSKKNNGTYKRISPQPISKPNEKVDKDLGCLVYTQPSVTWLRIWCTQAFDGVRVHCNFVLNRMKGKPCDMILTIFEQNGPEIVNIDTSLLSNTYKHEGIKDTMCLKRTLKASFDSTIWNDIIFDISYSALMHTDKKFLSIFGFEKECMFHMRLYIVSNGKAFDNIAVHNMIVYAEKRFLKDIQYSVKDQNNIF